MCVCVCVFCMRLYLCVKLLSASVEVQCCPLGFGILGPLFLLQVERIPRTGRRTVDAQRVIPRVIHGTNSVAHSHRYKVAPRSCTVVVGFVCVCVCVCVSKGSNENGENTLIQQAPAQIHTHTHTHTLSLSLSLSLELSITHHHTLSHNNNNNNNNKRVAVKHAGRTKYTHGRVERERGLQRNEKQTRGTNDSTGNAYHTLQIQRQVNQHTTNDTDTHTRTHRGRES
jgi:hypothetical protein